MGIEEYVYVEDAARKAFDNCTRFSYIAGLNIYVVQHPDFYIFVSNAIPSRVMYGLEHGEEPGPIGELPLLPVFMMRADFKKPVCKFSSSFEQFYQGVCKGKDFVFMYVDEEQEVWQTVAFEEGTIAHMIDSCTSLIEMNRMNIAEMLVRPLSEEDRKKVYQVTNSIVHLSLMARRHFQNLLEGEPAGHA